MIQFGNVMYGMLLEGTTTDGTVLTKIGQKVSGTNIYVKLISESEYAYLVNEGLFGIINSHLVKMPIAENYSGGN